MRKRHSRSLGTCLTKTVLKMVRKTSYAGISVHTYTRYIYNFSEIILKSFATKETTNNIQTSQILSRIKMFSVRIWSIQNIFPFKIFLQNSSLFSKTFTKDNIFPEILSENFQNIFRAKYQSIFKILPKIFQRIVSKHFSRD